MSDCVREKEEGKEIHGEAIVTMIFFFLPIVDSGRLLIGEEKREREREGGIKEIRKRITRKVHDLFTRVIRLH